MSTKHMNLKRISHRVKEEVSSTMEVAKVVGIKGAFASFRGKVDIQIMVHNGHIEHPWIRRHLLKKHEAMNAYFEKVFTEFNENGVQKVHIPKQDENYKDCIWICWWQGLENAPDIVKKCVESIQIHAGNHKVVIITDENYKKFVTFPTWIEEKYRSGIITRTHLSDLLRISLLAQYGGIWLDSTFFCVGNLEPYFSMPIWSIKRPDYRHVSVSCGEFANYSFGCTTEYRKVFAILLEYLLNYWKNYDYMIDYLFLDYLIVLARKQNTYVNQVFNKIIPNNKNCDELLKVLGNEFDSAKWEKLRDNTVLFKLTWKADFPKIVNGKKTYYGEIMNGELNVSALSGGVLTKNV